MGGCISVCRSSSLVPKTSSTVQEKVQKFSDQVDPPQAVVADDPDARIIQLEQQLAATPVLGNHPNTAQLLNALTTLYIRRYKARGDVEDLDKVILNLENAILTAKDHGTQSTFYNKLGRTLLYRYEALGNNEDLEAAISNAEQAVDLMPDDDPMRSGKLSNLATFLSYRYEQTENLDDLNVVISKGKQAVDAASEGSGQRVEGLQNLATYLFFRYQRLGNVHDLEEAIDKAEKSIIPTPHGNHSRHTRLMNLAGFLLEKYELIPRAEDLDKAIASAEEATHNTPHGHLERAGMLTNYGQLLRTRFEATSNINDLNDAISNCQEAVDATRSGHVLEQGVVLDNLANCFSARYRRMGNTEDLAAAILHSDRAIQATPREHTVSRVAGLAKLATLLCDRYERTGDLADLEASISKAEEAVAATSKNHPKLPSRMCNLARSLFQRYMTTGDTVDLVRAIAIAQEAEALRVSLALPEDTALLSSLGLFLSEQYQRTGDLNDLDTAILKTKRAIHVIEKHSHDRAVWLISLGAMLASRYNRTRADSDLGAAISSAKEALDATPPDHPDHAGCQTNLAMFLLRRYQLKGERADIAAAVSSAEASARCTPDDHPDRAAWVNNLGTVYWYQHRDTQAMGCIDAALNCFLEASQCSTSPPLQRVSGARQAIRILHQRKDLSRAASVVREAILLLPRVCSRSLKYTDQHFAAFQTSGLAADACSIFLQADMVEEALQAVEFGRGLTLGYLTDSRSDMSQLKHMHPSLAESYEKLRSKAFNQVDMHNTVRRNQCLGERREDFLRLEEMEDHIRSIPGFQQFLLPPPVEELMECAAEGPLVVVNITDLGSHAIIVSTSDIRAVPLPDATSKPPPGFEAILKRYEVGRERYLRDFECETPQYGTDLLSWLWKTCIEPIFEKLPEHNWESSGACETPRVWWIGTGAASSLPFHAAGLYDHDGGTPGTVSLDNCLDRVTPSYTPSIKALRHSRESAARFRKPDSSNLSALLVAMPTTPGLRPLPGVLLEKDAIRETVGDAFGVKDLTGPNAQEVLSALPGANIVHFACHGASHRNPSMSHLFLQRSSESGMTLDKLTVSAILEASPQGKGWLAYLSACSTAEVKAKAIAEENIHIASAFQVAGFAHVIGSLWKANDDICVRVAKLFYHSLLENREARDRNRAVAAALRYALLQIRKEYLDEPELWALYTHLGA